MKQDDVHDKLLEQKEAIDTVGNQLRWILSECQKKDAKPGTKFGNEMIQRFFSLYRDFAKIRENTAKLADAVSAVKFDDATMGMIYKATAQLLLRRCNEGIFRQFASVAETGRLPEKP